MRNSRIVAQIIPADAPRRAAEFKRWAGMEQRQINTQQTPGTVRMLTRLRVTLAAQTLLLLSACAVHQPYPKTAWGPLPPPPAEDCLHFEGSYHNRGEMVGHEAQPSLALELFGKDELLRATRVNLSLPTNDTLEVAILEGRGLLFDQTLTSPADFICKEGRLVIRSRRFFAESAVSGWENVAITLIYNDDYLLAQVESFGVGAIFLVIPVGGKTTSWYRFRRERE